MKKSLLTTLFIFMFFSSIIYGQKKFKDLHQHVWIKSIPTSNENIGFNYNLPLNFDSKLPVLNKKYTSSPNTYVFYVTKSSLADQKLFSLYNSGQLHSFYTNVIKSELEVKVDLNYLSKGAVINFNFYNKNYSKSKKDNILYLENTYDKSTTELYEVLVCSDCTDSKERNKIETYLALKYGVTLKNKEKYINGLSQKIWDDKYDSSFNTNIIGIVRDDYFSSEQNATSSNEEKDITVKKSESQGNLVDQTFVLIADNNKVKEFDIKTGKFKRQWLVQNSSDNSVKIDFVLKKKPEKDINYKLYTSTGKEFLPDPLDTLQLNFKNINIANKSNIYLSLEGKEEFNIKVNQDTLGINTSYLLTSNAVGEPPFSIFLTDLESQNTHFFISDKLIYSLNNLPTSTYSIEVKDAHENKIKLESIYLEFTDTNKISMRENWQLHGKEFITIKPQLTNNKQQYSYQWYFQDKLISSSPSLKINYPGSFVLEMSDIRNRKQRFTFSVSSEAKDFMESDSQWIVTPNPVPVGEEFSVNYLFNSSKDVDFYIYTVDGKFIMRKKYGIIGASEYKYHLNGATTYILISIINNKTSIQKLIVK